MYIWGLPNTNPPYIKLKLEIFRKRNVLQDWSVSNLADFDGLRQTVTFCFTFHLHQLVWIQRDPNRLCKWVKSSLSPSPGRVMHSHTQRHSHPLVTHLWINLEINTTRMENLTSRSIFAYFPNATPTFSYLDQFAYYSTLQKKLHRLCVSALNPWPKQVSLDVHLESSDASFKWE